MERARLSVPFEWRLVGPPAPGVRAANAGGRDPRVTRSSQALGARSGAGTGIRDAGMSTQLSSERSSCIARLKSRPTDVLLRHTAFGITVRLKPDTTGALRD